MVIAFLMVLGGFALLALGGEALVKGAVGVAQRLNVPPLIIGLTLVAFGTSAPELMVSIQAGLSGNPGIAIGNVVGSNIANILLVLGATALVSPLPNKRRSLSRDSFVMMGVTLGFVLLAFSGEVGRFSAIGLLVFLTFYLLAIYRREKTPPEVSVSGSKEEAFKGGTLGALTLLLGGVVGVVWGADILVEGAVIIAREYAVPEAVIGLSLVAIGTSLPELAISVLAAFRGQVGVAIGNVIGSNIFNICLILGVAGLITPLQIAPQIINFDVWVMAAATLMLTGFILAQTTIGKITGGGFLIGYGLYIAALFVS